MSEPVMTLRVVTPSRDLALEQVLHLRFEASDGSRGVLPGHERSSSIVREGALYARVRVGGDAQEVFIATEGGMAVMGPSEVVVVTSWAAVADDLATLAEQVRARGPLLARIDAEARTMGQRHETALRRALAGLKREISW